MNESDIAEPRPPQGLRRERAHRMLGGVCSGLGRRCDLDPVIFRIGLAVLAVTGGLGLIFYGFAWLLLPLDGKEETEGRRLLTGRVSGAGLTALLCALVGCGLFLSMLNNGGVLAFAAVLALLLAGAGYWSQARAATTPDPVTAQTVADAPPEAKAPPVAGPPSWWRDGLLKDGAYDGGAEYFWGPRDLKGVEFTMASGSFRHGRERLTEPEAEVKPKPRGPRWIGGWVFLLALLAGGLGTGLVWSGHGADGSLGLSLQAGLACALAVLGLGIAVSAFLGRTGGGSIVLAVLTAVLLTAAAALPENINTHWMRTEWRPTDIAKVRPVYEVGSGVGTLDLGGVDLRKGQTLSTAAEVGAGRAVVVVPKDATVQLRAEVGVGDIRLPDEPSGDVDIAPGQESTDTLVPPPGTKEGGTLILRIQVGVGQVEVTRAPS
ncbi:PspC domain-containing protein [Streptomyces boluensis]|uniref:PspC domain-containing protein n=1 Tax=Streptomyces boluensis TaxID=1775135 RepID=A0A964XMR8_9ACTN|nr:PspC domain-containing protein [Streptomyces boluensis]NBE53451.1 PspC domain-containing protein [Streptomyces boluensis]